MRKLRLLLCFFVLLCTYFHVNAQGNCPWHVKMEKHDATCIGKGGVTFTLLDDNGNPIELTTEVIDGIIYAVPTDPGINLSRIRFYCKGVSDTIPVYSPNPNFPIPNEGEYLVGVSAQCIQEGSGSGALTPKDTSITVTIYNLYVSPSVDILGHIATNSTDYGYRPSAPCKATGRIQLAISGGSFPYYIKIYNLDTQDTIRYDTIREPQYNGYDMNRFDYKDYYTFDSLPAGNYRFFFTDGCDYSKSAPNFTWEIEEIQIPEITRIAFYKNRNAYNIFHFSDIHFSSGDIKDYLYDDYQNILQYRVIYGDLYTSDWKAFPVQNLHRYDDMSFYYEDYSTWSSYLYDTANINRLCDMNGKKLIFQLRTSICGNDDIKEFTTGEFYPYLYISYSSTRELLDYNGTYYDSCSYYIPHIHNKTTEVYGATSHSWDYLSNGYNYSTLLYSVPSDIASWSITDVETGQVIKSSSSYQSYNNWWIDRNELEDFYGSITDTSFYKDMRLDIIDGQGCSYTTENQVHITDQIQSPRHDFYLSSSYSNPTQCCNSQNSVIIYEYTTDYSDAYCNPIPQRYKQIRDGARYKLVKSPRGNKYNFTATYHFDSDSWEITKDSLTNNAEIVPYLYENSSEHYWGLELRDYCLPEGEYKFVYFTDCYDSITHSAWIWGEEEKIYFEHPEIEIEQSCGKLDFSITGGYVKRQAIGTNTDDPLQPERIEEEYNLETRFRFTDGPLGGYNEEYFGHNETVHLTRPGDYTLRMYSPEYTWYCNEESYYDTVITYSGGSISFESTTAYVCDADSTVGFVFCNVNQGTAPFTYTLYSTEENGNVIIDQVNTENVNCSFTYIPDVHVGDVLSLGIEDACNNTLTFPIEVKDFISSDFAWFDGRYDTKEMCEGTMIDVYVSATNDYFTYHWTGPNGFDTITPRAQIIIARGSEPGYYTVELGNTGCSRTLKDTVTLNVQQAPKVRMEYSESNICPGKTVTLMFTPEQGVGTITYTIGRSVNSIDTFYTFSTELHETTTIQYTAISDAIFWINDVTDELCNYTIPEDTVVISLRNAATACDVTVNSPQVCFDATAELTASSSTMVKPYTIRWYDNPYQQNVLKTDVIEEGMSDASFTTGKLQADSTLYVTIQDATHCETYTGTVNQWMNMDNGTTPLTCGQSIRLFDDGGSNGNYLSGKYYKHTFTSTDGNLITLSFNSFNTQQNGDVMRVYTGAEVLQDSLLALISGSNLPESLTSNGTSMTIVFVSNSATEAEGWDALVSCSALPAQANIKVLEDLSVTLSISPEMPARYGQSYTLTAVANGGQGSRYEFTWHITDKDYNEIQSSSHELASNTDIYNLDNLTETRNVWVVVKDKSDYPCTTKDKMSNLIQIEIADIALNLELSSTVNEICQGDIPMIVKIKNEGSQTANNVKVKLALPDGMSLTDEADSLILFPEINAQGTVYDTLFIRNEAHVSTSTSMDIRAQIWSCNQGDNNSNWHNWDWTGNPNEADESIYTLTIRPSLDIVNAPGLTVSSADICFGGDATIQAHSSLDYPQHFIWYADAALTQVIKDTTLENNTSIIVSNEFTNITQEGALCYVMVENSNYCPAYTTVDYRTKMQYAPTDTILMHNGSSMVGNADHIRFFDDGGADNNYAPNKRYGYLFTSVDGSPLAIYFDENNYIYNYNNNARIEIYDGESDMTPRIARYTTSEMTGKVLVATTGKMFIKFYSDDYTDQGISAHVFTTSRAMVAEADVTFKTPMAASEITTTDDQVCYGENATLTASALNLAFPQTHYWYDENLNPVDTITVEAADAHSTLPISSVTSASNYYVTVSNADECPVPVENIQMVIEPLTNNDLQLNTSTNGRATNITNQDVYAFYDEGGANNDYFTHDANWTHTFTATDGGEITLFIKSFESESCCDYMRIYDGASTSGAHMTELRGANSNLTYTSTTGSITILWHTDGSVVKSGWDALVYTTTSLMAKATASIKLVDPNDINTNDVTVCYGDSATLTASANLSYPQYYTWYAADRITEWKDTIYSGSSELKVLPTSEKPYYVTVSCDTSCPVLDEYVHDDHVVLNMNGQGSTSYNLTANNIIDFYDAGGPNNDYEDCTSSVYYFNAEAGSKIRLHFNYVNLGDDNNTDGWLYIYDNNTGEHITTIIGTKNDLDSLINSSSVRIEFTQSCNSMTYPGWDGYIYAITPKDTSNLAKVNVSFAEPSFSQNVTTSNAEACYGNTVTLTATNIGSTSRYAWYDENYNLIKDTIGQYGTLDVTAIGNATYYVNASAANECPVMPPHYGAFVFDGSKNNGTTDLTSGKYIELFDAGGPDNNYNTPGANWTHTFRAPAGKQVTLKLNSFRTSGDHHLYIYDGTPDNSVNSWNRSGNYGNNMNYTRTSSNGILTVRWYIDNNSNANNFTYPGWEGEIGVLDDNNVMQLAHPDLAAANVSIKAPIAASEITTVDGEACHGASATLQAAATDNTLEFPQTFYWYDENLNPVDTDVVNSANEHAEYVVENVIGERSYYVTMGNGVVCPVVVENGQIVDIRNNQIGTANNTILLNESTHNVTTTVTDDDVYAFYDDGGPDNEYYAEEEDGIEWIHTFTADNNGQIQLHFNEFSSEDCCDYLQVYDGTPTNGVLLAELRGNYSDLNYRSMTGSITVVWRTDPSVGSDGWNARVYKVSSPMAQATATVKAPLAADNITTVDGEACYGADATIQASTELPDYPQTFIWYDMNLNPVDTDVVNSANEHAEYLAENVTSTRSYYVTMGNGVVCPVVVENNQIIDGVSTMPTATATLKTPLAAENITTVDGEACYGADATIQASTELPDYPQTFIWYDMNLNPVDTDVVNSANEHAEYLAENVTSTRSYYVTMGNGVVCPVVVENNQIIDGVSTMPTATATLKTPLAAENITTVDGEACYGQNATIQAYTEGYAYPQTFYWYDEFLTLVDTDVVESANERTEYPAENITGTRSYYVTMGNGVVCPVVINTPQRTNISEISMDNYDQYIYLSENDSIILYDAGGKYGDYWNCFGPFTYYFNTNPENRIRIHFNNVNLGDDNNTDGYLYLYNQSTGEQIAQITGTQSDLDYVINGGSLRVDFSEECNGITYPGWDGYIYVLPSIDASLLAEVHATLKEPSASNAITVTDAEACYGQNVTLTATADMSYPQHHIWLASDRITKLKDTVLVTPGSSTLSMPLTANENYYVYVSCDTVCELMENEMVDNGQEVRMPFNYSNTYQLPDNEKIRFYDTEGQDNSTYYNYWSYQTQYFEAAEGSSITLHFNSIDFSNGYFEIYDEGNGNVVESFSGGYYTDRKYTNLSNKIRVYFNNYYYNPSNWDAYIYATEPVDASLLKEVHATVKSPLAASEITTTDARVCFGNSAILTASAPNLAFPQTHTWYDENLNEVRSVPVEEFDGYSSYTVDQVEGTAHYYVSISNATECPVRVENDYNPTYRNVRMGEENGLTIVQANENITFTDQNGYSETCGDTTDRTHTFKASQGHVSISMGFGVELNNEDTLFVYDGNSTNDSLLWKWSGNQYMVYYPSFVSSGNSLTVRLKATSGNCYNGWNATVHTTAPQTAMAEATASVRIGAPESITAEDVVICYGDDAVLEASSNIAYDQTFTWYDSDRMTVLDPQAPISSGSSIYTIPHPTEEGTYYVMVTNDTTCQPYSNATPVDPTNLKAIHVSFMDAVVANDIQTEDKEVCYGETVTLTANSSNDYQQYVWYNESYEIIEGANTNTLEVTVTDSTTYYVNAGYAGDCVAAAPDNLVIKPNSANNGGTTLLTIGESIPFYDDGGISGNFSPNTNWTHTFRAQGNHEVTLVLDNYEFGDWDNCLWVYDGDLANYGVRCTLRNNSDQPTTVTSTQGALTLVWSSNNNTYAGWEGRIGVLDDNGEMTLRNNGLTEVHVSVKAPISPSIVTTNSPVVVCYGDSATLTASAELSYPQYYIWYGPDRMTEVARVPVTSGNCEAKVLPLAEGTYYVSAYCDTTCPVADKRPVNKEVVLMNYGGSYNITSDKYLAIYDDGGSDGNYSRTCTTEVYNFYASNRSNIRIHFNSVDVGNSDNSYIVLSYNDANGHNQTITINGQQTNLDYVVNAENINMYVTIGCDGNTYPGWDGYIYITSPKDTAELAKVDVSFATPSFLPNVTTADVEACYNEPTTLTASVSGNTELLHYAWYDENYNLLFDSIGVNSQFSMIANSEATYYVNASAADECPIIPPHYGEFWFDASQNGDTTYLTEGKSISFYDEGGPNNNYNAPNGANWIHYFVAPAGKEVTLKLNKFNTNCDHHLYVFDGFPADYSPSSYECNRGQINQTIHCSTGVLTVQWYCNPYTNSSRAGWEGEIGVLDANDEMRLMNQPDLAEAHVSIKAPVGPSVITTTDGEGCYGGEATLTATSTLDGTQHFYWYDGLQFVFDDPVNAGEASHFVINNVTGTKTYYVTVGNGEECPVFVPETLGTTRWINANLDEEHNGTTTMVMPNDQIDFYDEGGSGSFTSHSYTRTFKALQGQLYVENYDYVSLPDGDVLYVYDGEDDSTEPIAQWSGSSYPSTSFTTTGSSVTFKLVGHDQCCWDGWHAVIRVANPDPTPYMAEATVTLKAPLGSNEITTTNGEACRGGEVVLTASANIAFPQTHIWYDEDMNFLDSYLVEEADGHSSYNVNPVTGTRDYYVSVGNATECLVNIVKTETLNLNESTSGGSTEISDYKRVKFYDMGGKQGSYGGYNNTLTHSFTAPTGQQVYVTFSDDIRLNKYDFLRIYNGGVNDNDEIAVITYDNQNSVPRSYSSTSNTMTFVLEQNGNCCEQGWEAIVATSPTQPNQPVLLNYDGGTTTVNPGETVDFYDGGGANGDAYINGYTSYTHTFTASSGKLKLTFNNYYMYTYVAHLYVYNGTEANSDSLLADYSYSHSWGENDIPEFISSGSSLTVKLQNDYSGWGFWISGWSAEVTATQPELAMATASIKAPLGPSEVTTTDDQACKGQPATMTASSDIDYPQYYTWYDEDYMAIRYDTLHNDGEVSSYTVDQVTHAQNYYVAVSNATECPVEFIRTGEVLLNGNTSGLTTEITDLTPTYFYDKGGKNNGYDSYDGNTLTHTFTAPEGQQVYVTFSNEIYLNYNDHLRIYNGTANGDEIVDISRDNQYSVSRSFHSTTNMLTFIFEQGGSCCDQGWEAIVATSPMQPNQQVLLNYEQNGITTHLGLGETIGLYDNGGYDGSFGISSGEQYTHTFTADQGKVQISFKDYIRLYSAKLSVYDGTTANDQTLLKEWQYSQDLNEEVILTSSGSSLTVKLSSDNYVCCPEGWRAEVTALPELAVASVSVKVVDPSSIVTTDDEICYGDSASLTASSEIGVPQYYFWYGPDRMDVVKYDTVWAEGGHSTLSVLTGMEETYYVTVTNDTTCQFVEQLYTDTNTVLMGLNGSSSPINQPIDEDDFLLFYDAGGPNGSMDFPNGNYWSQELNVTAPEGSKIRVHLNSFNRGSGRPYMYIYKYVNGHEEQVAYIGQNVSDKDYIIESNRIRLTFSNNGESGSFPGWDGYIYAIVPRNANELAEARVRFKAPVGPSSLTTNDPVEVCYGSDVTLTASSTLDADQYFVWYDEDRVNILKRDTVHTVGQNSTLTVTPDEDNTTYYVAVTNAANCPIVENIHTHYEEVLIGQSYQLLPYDSVGFFDDGGRNSNYQANSSSRSSYFTAEDGSHIRIHIDTINLARRAYLRIRDEENNRPIANFSGPLDTANLDFLVESSRIYFYFDNDKSNLTAMGWNAYIYAITPHNEDELVEVNVEFIDPVIADQNDVTVTDKEACYGETVTLTATVGSTEPQHFVWYDEESNVVKDEVSTGSNSLTVVATEEAFYYVNVSSPEECPVLPPYDDIDHYALPYGHITIKAGVPATEITTVDDEVCFGSEATLTATSDIDFPQYYTWFAPDRITILKRETVNEGGHASYTFTPEEETDYYVAISNDNNCPTVAPIHNHYDLVLMDGSESEHELDATDSVRFYDAGGPNGDYWTDWSNNMYFVADQGSYIRIHFDTVNFARDAYLHIYKDNWNESNTVTRITGAHANLDYIVEGNRVMFYFGGYSNQSALGWEGYIYAIPQYNEEELAAAHVSFMQPTFNSSAITTTNAEACLGGVAELTATSTLTSNQYFAWYDNEMNLLRQEVIPSGEYSELPVEVLTSATYYVNVSTENECPVLPPHYGEFWFNASVNGGTTNLAAGEAISFFDAAGPDDNYITPGADWTHTFIAPEGRQVRVNLDYFQAQYGHRLKFYNGTTSDNDYINDSYFDMRESCCYSDDIFTSPSNVLTIRWQIQYNENEFGNYRGWDGLIGVLDDNGSMSTNQYDFAEAIVSVLQPTVGLPVTTTNDTVCYGSEAHLTASSSIDYPQYYNWYAPDASTILLRDTVDGTIKTKSSLEAPYYYQYQDQQYFVAVGNNDNCPPVLMNANSSNIVLLNEDADGQTTVIAPNEVVKFYDAGGRQSSYHEHNSDYTHTFQALQGTLMVKFNSNNTSIGQYDTLYVYDSDQADNNHLLGKVINRRDENTDERVMDYDTVKFYSTGQYMTFRFESDGNNWTEGWDATIMPYNLQEDFATADVIVKVTSVPEMSITTHSDTICYGNEAVVSASANLSYPQYYTWYDSRMNILQQDTLWNDSDTESVLNLPAHYNSESYYAYIYSDTVSCMMSSNTLPKISREICLTQSMNDGEATVGSNDSITFISGNDLVGNGNSSYSIRYFFTAEDGLIQIHFDELELADDAEMEFTDPNMDINFGYYEDGSFNDLTITSMSNHLEIYMYIRSSRSSYARWNATVTNIGAASNNLLSKMTQADVVVELNNSVATVTTTDDTVCIGSPALLTASSSIGFPQYYTWYNEDMSQMLHQETIESGVSNYYVPGQVGNATYKVLAYNDTICAIRPVEQHNIFREYNFDDSLAGQTLFVGATDSLVIYDDGGKYDNYEVPENEVLRIMKLETYPGATITAQVTSLTTDDDEEAILIFGDSNEQGYIDIGEEGENLAFVSGTLNYTYTYHSTSNVLYIGWSLDEDAQPMAGFEMTITTDMHPEKHLADAKVVMRNKPSMDYNALSNATGTVICQGDNAELEATSNLTENPQYFLWYSSDLSRVLGADTVYSGNVSHVSIPNLMQDTLMYVAVGTDEVCPAYPMAHKTNISELYLNASVNGGTTQLTIADSVLFYDDGGPEGNYSNKAEWIHTFTAESGQVAIHFHNFNTEREYDYLYIADGEADEDHVIAMLDNEFIDQTFTSTTGTLIVFFESDKDENRPGWFASVYTTEQVSADMSVLAQAEVTVNPSYQFEVYDTTNASRAPYSTADNMFRNIDVSAEGELIIDSVFHTALGCDSTYTLHLMVLPATVQDIIIASNSNNWTYDGWYHREEVYTVVYGLDTLTADAGSDGKVFTMPGTGDVLTITPDATAEVIYFTPTPVPNSFSYVLDNETDYPSVTTDTGTLEITPIATEITITANSASKYYDGTPLTNDGFTYTPTDILVEGDTLVAEIVGTITEIGDSLNRVVSYQVLRNVNFNRRGLASYTQDVTNCYTFALPVSGTLSIVDTFTVSCEVVNGGRICPGSNDGTATITIEGGKYVSPDRYEYSIVGDNTGYNNTGHTEGEIILNTLSPDSYTVTATDALGLTATATFSIVERPVITTTTVFECPNNIDTVIKHSGCNITLMDIGTPNFVAPAGMDMADVTIYNNAPADHIYEVGETTVTWVAKGMCGDSVTCDQIIKVSFQTCPDAVDFEGNSYPSVRLGSGCKCWTTENLVSTKYSDGRDIDDVMDYYSYEYPDVATNVSIFGHLYNWYAAADTARYGSVDSVERAYHSGNHIQGICPDGWYLPSDEEYDELNIYPTTDLRSTEYWIRVNGVVNTNATGFNSLPGGMYNCSTGRFESMMGNSYYWTCHPVYDLATGAMIDYICEKIVTNNNSRCNGYSIRCIWGEH